MYLVPDIRETRVWQEAREEGRQEGLKEGTKEGIKQGIMEGLKEGLREGMKEGLREGMKDGIALAIEKMAARNIPAEEIAAILEVDMALVRQVCQRSAGRSNG